MNRRRARSLSGLPRMLCRRARRLGRARTESRLQPRLRFDAAAPELLLSPHWDDAALDCWSLLASERDLCVLNLFAGVPPAGQAGVWEAVSGARDSAERARERIAEDERALALARRTPSSLPLLDVQYRRRQPAPGLDELDRAVSAEVQGASRVYAPAGIGAHADHLLARSYARALLRTGMPVTLYAELPYCIFHGWPSWVDASEPEAHRNVDAYWLSFLRDVPEMPPLHAADVSHLDRATAASKLEAINCYQTSLNYAVRRMLADPALHGLEVRWQLLQTSSGR